MSSVVVLCCDCDNYRDIEETRKIELDGLKVNLYICNECLEDLPRLDDKVLAPPLVRA
jgi:hypothetical protein